MCVFIALITLKLVYNAYVCEIHISRGRVSRSHCLRSNTSLSSGPLTSDQIHLHLLLPVVGFVKSHLKLVTGNIIQYFDE